MPVKISIEGNIGSGKSSVISRLCQDIRVPVFLEPVDEWKDWLTLFYQNPGRWGMSFNINVLLSFNKWKNNDFFSIYERSPISNRYIFSQLQFDQGRMNNLEKTMFEQLYDKLAWTPDVIIYIRADPHVSMERMKKRARACENEVPIEYLTAVHEKYEDILNNPQEFSKGYYTYLPKYYLTDKQKECRVIIVDGNRSHDEVYADVLSWVKSYM